MHADIHTHARLQACKPENVKVFIGYKTRMLACVRGLHARIGAFMGYETSMLVCEVCTHG